MATGRVPWWLSIIVVAVAFTGAAQATMSSHDFRAADIPWPGGRAPSPAEVDLGRSLFFEPRLSSTNTIACATCHRPDRGFGDGQRFSVGVAGTPLKRHTPHLFNLAWGKTFFWDGRAASLEEQALAPLRAPDEMGLPGDAPAQKLKSIPDYVEAFDRAYPKSGITMKNLARAIAAFERTIVSHDSAFDRHQAGDRAALDEGALRGKELFFGRARCSTCHGGANFTDGIFHNTGVLGADIGRAAFDRVGEFQMRPYPFFQMRRAFKTPGLRNVALTAPYQHDGSEATLEEVVRFYNLGGRDPQSYGKALDIRPLNLTESELVDLVSFLHALTSPVDVSVSLTGTAAEGHRTEDRAGVVGSPRQ
jgi:cytochrome c peroxidase